MTSTLAAAQVCPGAETGKLGFVVERGDRQKSEVYHLDNGMVRSVMRYNGSVLLERTEYEGLFDLDRLDKGRRTKYEPQTDLKKLFPLAPGRMIAATLTWESGDQHGTQAIEMTVKAADVLYIGPCKYAVLKIDRSETRSASPPRFIDTEYYSPELKLILAREFRESNGGTQIIKYDRIYPLEGSPSPGKPAPPPPAAPPRGR